MAIKMAKDSKLRVSFQTGLTYEGKPIYKTRSFSNVIEDVTPDQLSRVGEALASLSTYPLGTIQHSLLHEIL